LDLDVAGSPTRSLLEDGQRLFGPTAPLQDLRLDGEQLGLEGRFPESLVDPLESLVETLLAQGGDGQIRQGEWIVRCLGDQLSEKFFGLGGLLVLQLGQTQVAQAQGVLTDGSSQRRHPDQENQHGDPCVSHGRVF